MFKKAASAAFFRLTAILPRAGIADWLDLYRVIDGRPPQ
jgi:hypothetical protein